MNGDAYNFRKAFCTKYKESNQFPMDTLNVLLELVMIRDRIFTRYCLASNDTVYMINSI